jgi:antitoxin component of MazEF toxin-antitoxin module
MVTKIKTVAKIINIGNSIGVTISKDVKALLELQKGDYVQLTIEKVEKEGIKQHE